MPYDLDSIDYNIVRELASDARLSFAELGRRVGLSPSAVAERVRQLENEGIILGYRAILDEKHVGAGRFGDGVGKTSPQADGAKTFVQHDDGRRGVRARADHAVFEPQRIEIEKAFVGERHDLPSSRAVTVCKSLAKLCSIASPDVSISASARE